MKVATAISSARDTAADELLQQLEGGLGSQEPALVLVFASPDQSLATLLARLQGAFSSAVVLGCTAAGEFLARDHRKQSVVALAVAGELQVHAGLARGLKADPVAAAQDAVGEVPEQPADLPHRTALLLLDPLAGNGEEVTLLIAAQLGADARLAGGAAGDDLRMESTLVGLGTEVAEDAIVVATIFSASPFGVGVSHGHRSVSGSLKVTRAEGNVVHSINGRPAWDVWQEQVRAYGREADVDFDGMSDEHIGALLLRYEAGLASGDELKIRAPLARKVEDGSMQFACGMPTGTVFRLTIGEPHGQIASAREAARRARREMGGGVVAGAIVFDCMCRSLILGDRFGEAVRGISDELGGAPLAGFETYGEIALDVGELSGFHNSTTVVLAIGE